MPLGLDDKVHASPHLGLLGDLKEPLDSRPCYLLFLYPWARPSSVLFIEVFVQFGDWERELSFLLPSRLLTLMFTAPELSVAPRALPLPADSKLTASIGLRTIWDLSCTQSLHCPLPSSTYSLPRNQQAGHWLDFLK